jgi:hypothetical protein
MVLAGRKTPAQEVVDKFAWLDEHFAINLPAEYSTNMPQMVDVCIWWYLKVLMQIIPWLTGVANWCFRVKA